MSISLFRRVLCVFERSRGGAFMRFVSFAPRAIVLFVWAGLLTRYESAMEIGCVGDLLCLRGLALG